MLDTRLKRIERSKESQGGLRLKSMKLTPKGLKQLEKIFLKVFFLTFKNRVIIFIQQNAKTLHVYLIKFLPMFL